VPLTVQEFHAGVAAWPVRWPDDLHNDFYARMAAQDPRGEFDEDWWVDFVPHLTAWKALRPVGPRSVTTRVRESLPALRETWAATCAGVVDRDVTGVHWKEVEDFVSVVRSLKRNPLRGEPVHSPVFTAKFCHFLLPAVFPVVDRKVMGLPFGLDYRAHFEAVQREWESTPEAVQDDLQRLLREEVGAPLTAGYPVVNKVVELCLIGRRH
jgi:hypothetical protein